MACPLLFSCPSHFFPSPSSSQAASAHAVTRGHCARVVLRQLCPSPASGCLSAGQCPAAPPRLLSCRCSARHLRRVGLPTHVPRDTKAVWYVALERLGSCSGQSPVALYVHVCRPPPLVFLWTAPWLPCSLAQCSRCVPGVSYRYPFSPAGVCVPCPRAAGGVMFAYLLVTAAVSAGLLAGLLHGSTSAVSFVRLAEFLQLLYVVGMVDADWPRSFVSQLFPFASTAVLNLDLGALGCLSSSRDQLGAWVFSLLLPLCVILALLLLAAVGWATTAVYPWLLALREPRRRLGLSSTEVQEKRAITITGPLFSLTACNAATGVACASFAFAVRTALDPLRCRNIDGVSVMVADPAVLCADASQGARWALGIAFTVLYGILVPGCIAGLLRWHAVGVRTDLRSQAAGRRASTPASNPFHFVHMQLSLAYNRLDPQWYLWSVVVLARKGCLLLVVSVLHLRPDDSVRVALVLLLLWLGLHGAAQPYLPPATNRSGFTHSRQQRWCV